jgi:hypothetical protein
VFFSSNLFVSLRHLSISCTPDRTDVDAQERD